MSLKTLITMRRYTYTLIIITSIILGSTIINNASAYVIDHNNHSVWVQGNYGKLEATPHTITQSGWVYFNITPYQNIGNIDMVWGFNNSEVKPRKAEFYKPHLVYWTTDHEQFFWNVSEIKFTLNDCCYGNSYNTYKQKITYQTGYNNVTNESITTTKTVCFDSYIHNGSNYTAYWHTDHSRLENWIDVSNKLRSVSYNYDNKTRWWYVTNFAVESYKTYTGRVWIDVPVTLDGISGKYDFAVKRSYDSLHDAINNNRFYLLDPWFDSSWSTKRNLHINYTPPTNISFIPTEDGHIYSEGYVRQNDYDYILSEGESSNGIYRGYIEWNISSIPDNAIITNVSFKYSNINDNKAGDGYMSAMVCKPSSSPNEDVWNDAGNGTVYVDIDGFPEIGSNNEVNLGTNAISDLQNALSDDWFAIGIRMNNETDSTYYAYIDSEDYASANPKPTLCIEYTSEFETLNYYQMNLNLSYSDIPEAQPDFDDIRFVNISDGASLPYWVEDRVNGSWCNVWVNITTLHVGWNNDTVALYYGNSEATSASDIGATFVFGDDFLGSSLDTSKWSTTGSDITNTVSDSQLELYVSDTSHLNYDESSSTFSRGHALRTKMRDYTDKVYPCAIYFGGQYDNDADGKGICTSDQYYLLAKASGSVWYGSGISDDNDFHTFEIIYDATVKLIRDGTELQSTTTDIPTVSLPIKLGRTFAAGQAGNTLGGLFDYVLVRKYAANPPTYGFGTAQYLAGSIHYNTTNPYNHTIESDGTITANRSICSADDLNWTASAVSDDCGLLVTQFNLSTNTITNFTVYDADLDWLRVTNLTVGMTYDLKNSSGIVESHDADASGEINYTTDLISGSYWIKLFILLPPAVIDTNYTILGNDALIIFSSTNTLVTFTATSNQTISHWYWTNATYLDGNGTASSNASHYYGVNGTYYVTVRGENVAGNFTDTTTWQINVGSIGGGTGGGTANGTYALIGTATPLGARKTTMVAAFVLLSGMFMMMLAKRYKEDEQDVT